MRAKWKVVGIFLCCLILYLKERENSITHMTSVTMMPAMSSVSSTVLMSTMADMALRRYMYVILWLVILMMMVVVHMIHDLQISLLITSNTPFCKPEKKV